MNEIARHIEAQHGARWPTSRAAEGLPRMAWTVDDLDRMVEAGILPEGGGVELLWGELVPMAAKGIRHEHVRKELLRWFMRRASDDIDVASELGWRPAADVYLEPEILIARRQPDLSLIPGADVLLLLEVSASSLGYDTGAKAQTYAKLGVREYWVVSAVTLETLVYRDPGPDAYPAPRTYPADDVIVPLLLPDLAVRIAAAVET
ncbi:MAG: Uma2 family endonuclease [Hyphomicrobiaceae bacterium]|nr:Uma2 family endonuclease [Hyphomicrobiaceae bacterium]